MTIGIIDHLSTVHVLNTINCVNPTPKSRRVVVSREAKKKQHACALLGLCDHYSDQDER